MKLLACGINHKTAPLALRERISFLPQASEPLLDLQQSQTVNGVAILSTCNRTEIYCQSHDKGRSLIEWLEARHHFKPQELQAYFYIHEEAAAVRHMLRVASGLDSMMLGEPQILGQMKTSFLTAQAAGTLVSRLGRLFQYIFSVTKQVRTQTGIGVNAISVVFAAINLIKHILTDLKSSRVLLVGSGETIELAARYLREQGVKQLWVASRNLSKAQQVANTYQGVGINLQEVPSLLTQTDIVITATASTLPLLGKGMVESALKQRRHKPIVMIDLAVPRDIEPEVAELADVYLYNIDDLQKIIANNLQSRKHAADQAETLIEAHTDHFMRSLRSLDAVATIRNYRERAENIRDQELHKALEQLQRGDLAADVLQRLARNLTNKWLHAPSVKMREAGYQGQLEILDAAARLFDLKDAVE